MIAWGRTSNALWLSITNVDKFFKCLTRQKQNFLRNIKIFVNYVSKYYNGTPSVRNRLISYTQVDMTCPRRVERDIPHLQWHNFLRFKQMCILRNINDTVTMWCLMLFITRQWLWIKTGMKFYLSVSLRKLYKVNI